MRLPNGYGSVHKLPGKRRKPWRVRITKDTVYNEEKDEYKQIYQTIGYYETRQKAMQALAEYHDNPYDLDNANLTFSNIYEKWSEEHFKGKSHAGNKCWKTAYNHCKPLYNRKFRELKVYELEQTIENAEVGDVTKGRMKNMFSLMYRWAIRHEIVSKDLGKLCKPIGKVQPTFEKTPFSEAEISVLWENILKIPYVDMILIEIYSGWRPSELTALETTDIDLETLTMKGGAKTDAGKNRIVPIHKRIIPLIKRRYNPDNRHLFVNEEGRYINYDYYYKKFKRVMSLLEMNHSPHETRHTFITLAKEAHLDEYCLKLIVGHEIDDITEKVYTHRKVQQLAEEINKIA